jgi:DNA-binding cell septation regulator SpoVG
MDFIAKVLISMLVLTQVVTNSMAATKKELNITVTYVKISRSVDNRIFGEVILNDKVRILDLCVEKNVNSGCYVLKLPEYVSKRGRPYPQVKVLLKELSDKIINSLVSGQPGKEPGQTVITWEITKFSSYKPTKKSALKMFAVIKFNDAVEVECKVFDSSKGKEPWVNWPAKKSKVVQTEYIPQVIIKKETREPIEQELIKRYKTYREEGGFESYSDEW